MAITTATSSGLDTKAIVDQLMTVQRQPLTKLQLKEADYQSRITAYASILSAVSNLKAAATALKDSSIMGLSTAFSDYSYMTAAASPTASPGTYNLSVNNLATAQSIYSLRYGSSSSAVASLSVNATQKLKIQTGSNTAQTITINSTNNTLSGIKDAINAAGAGVTASIIKESGSFTIDATNNTIVFNDGTANRTATIASGTYTGAGFAAAVQTALNGAPGSTNTFAVDYNTLNTGKFTITNSAGPAVSMLWDNTGTTAEQMLGFTPAAGAITGGGSAASSNTVDGSYRLILTANSTGTSNRITVKADMNNDGTFAGVGETSTVGLGALAFDPTYNATTGATTGGVTNMTQTVAGLDALFKLNGIEMSRSSNSISDLITGVTLNLLKADSTTYGNAAPQTVLTVAKDNNTVAGKVTNFITAYNKLASLVASDLGGPKTKGPLSGDSVLRTMMGSLNSSLSSTYNSTYLASLGIARDKTGMLALNSTYLNNALGSNSSSVVSTLNAMGTAFESKLTTYERDILPGRTDGYQKTVKSLQKSQAALQVRLTAIETGLRKRYAGLDSLLSTLQGTSSYLTQQSNTTGK